jgi:hypothetical protein
MKLLICGGRTFTDYIALCDAMKRLPFRPSFIIEGGAKGADRLGRTWAISNGVHYATVPALWDTHGNKAGPMRNSMMLLLNPNYCLALPGGTGTADMVKKCEANGIPTWRPLG